MLHTCTNYIFTHLPTYILPRGIRLPIYLPTHPPTYLLTHLLTGTLLKTVPPTYPPTYPPISYNLPTFVPHSLTMMCQNKHVKFF
jgi:hypothetical protein